MRNLIIARWGSVPLPFALALQHPFSFFPFVSLFEWARQSPSALLPRCNVVHVERDAPQDMLQEQTGPYRRGNWRRGAKVAGS